MGKALVDMPAELGVQIFKKCIEQRSISMLYLNKVLYDDFLPELYDFNVFIITINPSIPDSHVTLFGGTEHFLPVQSHHIREPACLVGKKVPFDKLKGINIRVLPPDPHDRG